MDILRQSRVITYRAGAAGRKRRVMMQGELDESFAILGLLRETSPSLLCNFNSELFPVFREVFVRFANRRVGVLGFAAYIGIFTALAREPADSASLSTRLGLRHEAAADFLHVLVELGLLEYRDGKYSNTRDGAALPVGALPPGLPAAGWASAG